MSVLQIRIVSAFCIAIFGLSVAAEAKACATTATYRSVIVNKTPTAIPSDATVYHVRAESAYVAGERRSMQGLRGVLVDAAGDLPVGTEIQITARLGSMCNTWVEHWSSDHDVTDGVLTGYIVGRIVGEDDGRINLWPALFRREDDRIGRVPEDGWWHQELGPRLYSDAMRDRWAKRMFRPPSTDGEWVSYRVDAEALANNLENTNRLIRENLEREAND